MTRSLYQFRGSSQKHHNARRSHRYPRERCGVALPQPRLPGPGRAATTHPPLPVPHGAGAPRVPCRVPHLQGRRAGRATHVHAARHAGNAGGPCQQPAAPQGSSARVGAIPSTQGELRAGKLGAGASPGTGGQWCRRGTARWRPACCRDPRASDAWCAPGCGVSRLASRRGSQCPRRGSTPTRRPARRDGSDSRRASLTHRRPEAAATRRPGARAAWRQPLPCRTASSRGAGPPRRPPGSAPRRRARPPPGPAPHPAARRRLLPPPLRGRGSGRGGLHCPPAARTERRGRGGARPLLCS